MEYLVAVPNADAIELLKSELVKTANKFILIGSNDSTNQTLEDILNTNFSYDDIKDYIYYQDEIHSSYRDNNGALTFSTVIPSEIQLTQWSYAVTIITADNKLIATTRVGKMQLVSGIGLEQLIKLTVSGEPNTIIFKKDNYLTEDEAHEIYINKMVRPLVANTNYMLVIHNKLMEKEII